MFFFSERTFLLYSFIVCPSITCEVSALFLNRQYLLSLRFEDNFSLYFLNPYRISPNSINLFSNRQIPRLMKLYLGDIVLWTQKSHKTQWNKLIGISWENLHSEFGNDLNIILWQLYVRAPVHLCLKRRLQFYPLCCIMLSGGAGWIISFIFSLIMTHIVILSPIKF